MLKVIETDKDKLLIGVISDTHIPLQAPKIPDVVINDLKEKNIDYLFALGDYVSYDAYKSIIDTFGEENVFAVIGNMDVDKHLKEILPITMEVEVLGHRIFMIHGEASPYSIVNRLKKKYDLSKCDIVIFGHTHQSFKKEKNGKLFINPGSVNDKKFTDINSYGYLHISKKNVEFEIVEL